jgi:CheY-like chemotaxis protein
MMKDTLGLKILLVEDDPDTRELLESFFRRHGYAVIAVASAHEGLAMLKSEAIDLVVSDNQLEGSETGAWMLCKASSSGLLRNVGALMYTGDGHPEVPSNVRVLPKPTALVDLGRAAEHAVASARGRALEQAVNDVRSELDEPEPPVSSRRAVSVRAELILYVTDSTGSIHAIRNLERILEALEKGTVALRLCDRSKSSSEAEPIAFVPTQVTRSPGRCERLVGEADEDPAAVIDLLVSCEVKGAR